MWLSCRPHSKAPSSLYHPPSLKSFFHSLLLSQHWLFLSNNSTQRQCDIQWAPSGWPKPASNLAGPPLCGGRPGEAPSQRHKGLPLTRWEAVKVRTGVRIWPGTQASPWTSCGPWSTRLTSPTLHFLTCTSEASDPHGLNSSRKDRTTVRKGVSHNPAIQRPAPFMLGILLSSLYPLPLQERWVPTCLESGCVTSLASTVVPADFELCFYIMTGLAVAWHLLLWIEHDSTVPFYYWVWKFTNHYV